jgi:serine/threonine-protein kinase
MGSVYEARDTLLERNVALKVLRPPDEVGDADSERAESIARLVREARAAAALVHPNIVTVYDVGELSGGDGQEPLCFIAMELVEGRSLREYVGKADVPLATRVGWLADVARALAFAHQQGIIHRDVKPDNVMIRHDGVVKVLDFGVARRTPSAAPHAASEVPPTLTGEGRIVGTLSYMAPEQMRGSVLDGRADQFS